MANGVSMMNPGVGITAINTPKSEDLSISAQRGGVSPALSLSGNEQGLEVYDGQNLDSIVESYLTPRSSDPDLMSPHVFQSTVESALAKLDGEGVSALGSELAQNNDIVRMYTALVIPG
ncbi:MAG: hypothetical protein MI747_04120 [Desulfobacterales bacterium]|nr:hypothetical protein [Desulfobacterales bacterium]